MNHPMTVFMVKQAAGSVKPEYTLRYALNLMGVPEEQVDELLTPIFGKSAEDKMKKASKISKTQSRNALFALQPTSSFFYVRRWEIS